MFLRARKGHLLDNVVSFFHFIRWKSRAQRGQGVVSGGVRTTSQALKSLAMALHCLTEIGFHLHVTET